MDNDSELSDVDANFAQASDANHAAFAQLTATNNQLSAELQQQQQANALLQQQPAMATQPSLLHPFKTAPPLFATPSAPFFQLLPQISTTPGFMSMQQQPMGNFGHQSHHNQGGKGGR